MRLWLDIGKSSGTFPPVVELQQTRHWLAREYEELLVEEANDEPDRWRRQRQR